MHYQIIDPIDNTDIFNKIVREKIVSWLLKYLHDMENELRNPNQTVFERIKEVDESGNEFWGARKLSKVLEYIDFRNFQSVINKAKEACKNSGQNPSHHIVEINEEIIHGKGAVQTYPSFKLSRYACYLIVQNADPSKEIVALGQTYFAMQTRLQEIQQMAEPCPNIYR
jgi:DNA-damage-inducible protein D